MGWEDRDYNDGGGGGGSDYLSNPAALLNYSLPAGTYGPVRVRLHIWMLLTLVFIVMQGLHLSGAFGIEAATLAAIALLFTVVVHEIGHRIAAMLVGGWHNEFMLWPLGGIVSPQAPPAPLPLFVANVGGIVANLALVLIFGVWGALQWGQPIPTLKELLLSAIGFAMPGLNGWPIGEPMGLPFLVAMGCITSVYLIGINLLPFYIFDGGNLLESILWPWTGRRRAINATCLAGMVIAVPLIFFSVYAMNLFGIVFWGLLFASSYMKRRALPIGETNDAADLLDFNIQASTHGAAGHVRRGGASRSFWGAKAAVKNAQVERRAQAKIDAILDKVRDHGMHSLNWLERRTLQQATERQRRKR